MENDEHNDRKLKKNRLLVSLSVLSSLTPFSKLKTGISEDRYVDTDKRFLQSLQRWICRDSREKTIHALKKLYDDAVLMFESSDDEARTFLSESIRNSFNGLDALAVTYQDDTALVANLTILKRTTENILDGRKM